MKKETTLRFAALLLCLIFILSAFTSCGNTGTAEESSAESAVEETTEAPVMRIQFAGGADEYVIVRADDASDDIVNAGVELREKIESVCGVKLTCKSDFTADIPGYRETDCEILLGSTNREASSSAFAELKYNDWVIRIVDKKIIILGGCDAATLRALDYFEKNFVTKDGVIETAGVLTAATYPVTKLTLNGKDISEYSVVYPKTQTSRYKEAIAVLQTRLQTLTGVTLTEKSSAQSRSGPEFQFGDCGRAPSEGISCLSGMSYQIRINGENIAFDCPEWGMVSAMTELLDEWFPSASEGELTVTLNDIDETRNINQNTALYEGADIRVMTSNILFDSTLSSRTTLLQALYMKYYPDFIGMQECNATGYSGVIKKLTDYYSSCATVIEGTSNSSNTPILYRKDLYNLLESKCVYFNKRFTNSKMVSYGVFENKTTGKKIAVINGHWSLILSTYDTTMKNSVEGAEWREDNSRQCLEIYESLRAKYGDSLTVFIMGDMNASSTSQAVQLLSTGPLKNSLYNAKISATTGINSFHNNPGQKNSGSVPIDNIIFSSDTAEVLIHKILTDDEAIAVSDHSPVYIDVKLK